MDDSNSLNIFLKFLKSISFGTLGYVFYYTWCGRNGRVELRCGTVTNKP